MRDRFLVGAGVPSLLAEVAGDSGVLCLVDDAQWLDQESADALTFAARRLDAEGVAILFAARDEESRPFPAPGIPKLRVDGLPVEAATRLALAHTDALAPVVLERVVELSGGNPLALLELHCPCHKAQSSWHTLVEISRCGLNSARAQPTRRVETSRLAEPSC